MYNDNLATTFQQVRGALEFFCNHEILNLAALLEAYVKNGNSVLIDILKFILACAGQDKKKYHISISHKHL